MAALTWQVATPDNPHDATRDQRADLLAHHWAEVAPSGWSDWDWTIIRAESVTCDQLTVAGGTAPTEADAKMAVEAWQASYHRNAVLVAPQLGRPAPPAPYRWRVTCRECDLYGHGLSLPDAYDIAVKHVGRTSCQDLWRERLVGVW